jgi:nitrous oxide reductase
MGKEKVKVIDFDKSNKELIAEAQKNLFKPPLNIIVNEKQYRFCDFRTLFTFAQKKSFTIMMNELGKKIGLKDIDNIKELTTKEYINSDYEYRYKPKELTIEELVDLEYGHRILALLYIPHKDPYFIPEKFEERCNEFFYHLNLTEEMVEVISHFFTSKIKLIKELSQTYANLSNPIQT